MHKIVIVEDDRIIRRSLCQAPWKKHGFTVVGEASNGEIAVDLIVREQPQVVISDINMPFMNGLQMAEQIKKISPLTRIIFLTGYEDFNYAKQAVKLQAFDYLLKPVNVEELIEKACEAAAEWEAEMQKEKKIVESLPLLEQRFLQKLTEANGENEAVDIETELVKLGIELVGPYYAAILIHVSSKNRDTDAKIKKLLSQLITTVTDQENSQLLTGEEKEMAVFLSLDEKTKQLKEQLASKILGVVKANIDAAVTITIGRTYSNLFDIGTSYVESKLAMDLRHIMGTNQFYSIDDTISNQLQDENVVLKLEEKLEKHIKKGLPKKAKEKLEKINSAFVTYKNVSLEHTRLFALKFSTLLTYEIKKWQQESTNVENSVENYDLIENLQSLEEVMAHLQRLIDEWTEAMSETIQTNHQSIVDKAMNYMKENYGDSTLTQQKVANEIFVSAPYLSNLFKLEKGVNFTEYLLEIRMKKAMELLRNPEAKSYQVAEEVGYSNPQYFSISFKKYTGYSPQQYSKMYG